MLPPFLDDNVEKELQNVQPIHKPTQGKLEFSVTAIFCALKALIIQAENNPAISNDSAWQNTIKEFINAFSSQELNDIFPRVFDWLGSLEKSDDRSLSCSCLRQIVDEQAKYIAEIDHETIINILKPAILGKNYKQFKIALKLLNQVGEIQGNTVLRQAFNNSEISHLFKAIFKENRYQAGDALELSQFIGRFELEKNDSQHASKLIEAGLEIPLWRKITSIFSKKGRTEIKNQLKKKEEMLYCALAAIENSEPRDIADAVFELQKKILPENLRQYFDKLYERLCEKSNFIDAYNEMLMAEKHHQ